MLSFSKSALLTLAAASAITNAAPIEKRIAQVITDATAKWVAACTAAGGNFGSQCQPVSQTAFTSLLAAGGDCDQQNAADAMIDLAKQFNNDPTMISLAQVFLQQPRNSPNSLSVNYCQQAPKNPELNGLFQCQFKGDNPTKFTGANGQSDVGAPGTIPLGMSAPLSPPGSCKANPGGPIADGSQLTDITTDPGVGNNASSGNSSASSSGTANAGADPSTAGSDTTGSIGTEPSSSEQSAPTSAASSSAPAPSSSSGGFQLSNGQQAQSLNKQFASLTTSSSCNSGDQGCIGGAFSQCVNGAYVASGDCSAQGLICAALPLVNKAGTSIACTTQADAEARIAATGAQGGLTGNN